MTITWKDHFPGNVLDSSKWDIEERADGCGNEELQIYTSRSDNVRVRDGKLIIEARKDHFGQKEYSSARMRTKGKADWKYGRISVMAKLPRGQGIWPAIWMLPTHDVYGTWAASGEIDIMEMQGHEPNKVYGSLHYGGAWPKNLHTTGFYEYPGGGGTFADGFHLYEISWRQGEIKWYVDKHCYQTQSVWETEGGRNPAPFDQEFHLLLNLAVGGRFPGNPDNSTEFPCRMVVDYVEVSQ